MAVTKVAANLTMRIASPDGVKLRKKEVADYLKRLLENGDHYFGDRMRVSKAVICVMDVD